MTPITEENKKLIPISTFYCYAIISIVHTSEGMRMKTKKCPFYKKEIETEESYCKALGKKETLGDFLLEDQVKICGINEPE